MPAFKMMDGYGARWHRFSKDPDNCPKCGKDMNDHDSGPPFSKRIGIEDMGLDRVTHWRCPFCEWEWPR